MWTCPKCGRTFKKQEQSHYCGKAPETIEEYIAMQPEGIRQYLKEYRTSRGTIRKAGKYWKGAENESECVVFF